MKICLLAMGLLCCMSYMINQSRRRIKEKRLNKHLNNLLKYYNKFQIYILGIFFSSFPTFLFFRLIIFFSEVNGHVSDERLALSREILYLSP